MRSARRRNRLKTEKRKKGTLLYLKILLVPFVLILTYSIVKLSSKYWNGESKISLVYQESNGDVAVGVLDPRLSQETTFIIPGATEVNVAANYGSLRIKNVWQLGLNEHLDGGLLAKTVSKDFLFPVFLWSGPGASYLQNPTVPGIIKFVFSPGRTNIPIGDRVLMGLYALKIKNLDKSEINLAKSEFLQSRVLEDGMPGYVLNGPVSERLTVYFADNDFSDQNLRVEINDATGSYGEADKVGELIQVLGGKVVSINRLSGTSDTDCSVIGKNQKMVEKVSEVFGCKKGNGQSNFDLEISLGSKFAQRY